MIHEKQIQEHLRAREEELSACTPNLLQEFPVEVYVQAIKSVPPIYNYDYVRKKFHKVLENIGSSYGLHALALYQKLVLTWLIKLSYELLPQQRFPREIKRLYGQWFERVFGDFSKQPDEYYDHRNDSFLKDLGVCSLRAVPVGGAWIVEVSLSRESTPNTNGTKKTNRFIRSFIRRIGLKKLFRYALFKMGFMKFYYLMHTVDRYLPRFTPEEMTKSYLRIADLMRADLRIKGIYRSAWFLDPQLENISPHLSYLRIIPEQNGAKVYRIRTRQSDIDNAIALSPLRRKLYGEGKYKPVCYAMFWPRAELLFWARKQRKRHKIGT